MVCPFNHCGVIWLLLIIIAPRLAAQDRVLIQQPGGSRFPITGYVEDYNGRELTLKIKPKVPARHYPRSEVIEVTTEYTPHHEQGRNLFAAGKITAANGEFSSALQEEDRPWVRREILASQVRCHLWNGDCVAAVSRFFPIVLSDSESFHYGLIPLNWGDDAPVAKLRLEAIQWMASSASPLSRLIGASCLLTDDEIAMEAEKTLKRLAREPDVSIQRLAQMQLWRLKLKGAGLVDPDEIHQWSKFVESLPTELRGGAHFVIGQAWQKRQEYEQAARAYLWLPLVYDSDRWLSSRACYEAAESLLSVGDKLQATNLNSEVVFRYGDTPWGTKAEKRWNALRADKSSQ